MSTCTTTTPSPAKTHLQPDAIEVGDASYAYVDMLTSEGMHDVILNHPVPKGTRARLQARAAGNMSTAIARDADWSIPE